MGIGSYLRTLSNEYMMDKDATDRMNQELRKRRKSADVPLDLYCDRLESSSLFRSYSQALASVIGCGISLVASEPSVGIRIPVEVTSHDKIWMKVKLPYGEADEDLLNVLKSFALQLSEESGRSVLTLPPAAPSPVLAAGDYIRSHITEGADLSHVSEYTDVSKYQLCRLFRCNTGMTMTEYANRLRVERAKRLLETSNLPILEVAERAGFVSLSQFNRAFLRYVGCSPSDFRISVRQMSYVDLLG